MLKIHKASAGSGKTYALTREYLKLLLGEKRGERYRLRPLGSYGYMKPKAHGEILAVTFTNKATEEMTSRIISELASLAGADGGGESPYLGDFMREFDTDEGTLREHARRALADVLYNFSWFNVSTIDSFFQRVLNTFTRELELPANHNVEIDDKYPLAVAVGKMLSSINSGDGNEDERHRRLYLERWLHQYMMSMVSEGRSFNLLSQTSSVNAGLISDMGMFFNEKYKINRAAIDDYLSEPSRIERFSQAISPSGLSDEVRGHVAGLCRRAADMADGTVKKLVADALRLYGTGDFTKAPNDTCRRGAEDSDACFKKGANPPEGMRRAIVEALSAAIELADRMAFYKYMYTWVFQLGLFGMVHRHLEDYRRQNDTLLLSDTNDLLRRIISEDETPFIYERMGNAIRHYLIDEFQDTSQMQWENLKPLVLESLSRGNDNLIIGDEKQCIYRFRNSDPQLLGTRVEGLVNGRFPGALQLLGADISDNCNWRSSAEVVRFNNTLFHSLARQLDGRDDGAVTRTYAGLIQRIPAKHADFHGYVKVSFLPTALRAGADGEGEESDLASVQLDRMVREIDRQLSSGYRPRDIAVLVRKRSQGKAVITRLMEAMEHDPEWHHGVLPVVSADSMEISLSPAVRMIVNVLRLATQPMMVTKPGGELDGDGRPVREVNPAYRRYRLLHRFEMCRFDQVEATDEAGNVVRDEAGNAVMRTLTDREALARAVAATSLPMNESGDALQMEIDAEIQRLAEMDSPTLQAMTERIIGKFLTADARRRENVFITAFQDLVMDFSERGENNLNVFLQWWDRCGSTTNVSAPEGLDAINVLTIHKAKGLEYECVHLPYCSDPLVKYHSAMVKSISWYRLDSKYFPGIDPDCVPPLMPLPNKGSNKEMEALRSDAQEWETEQKTDALNVAYVAFTRAVRELCVYVDRMATYPPKSTRKDPVMLFSDHLLQGLREMTPEHLRHCGLPDEAMRWLLPLDGGLHERADGELEFTLGAPTNKVADDRGADTGGAIVKGEPGEVDYGSLLDEYVVNDRSEICASMDFEDLTDFDINDDRHRGIFLHKVLGSVVHRGDLHVALKRQAYRYGLGKEEIERCGELLERALSEEMVKRWFEGFVRVANERPLTAPGSLRRPDRVVWFPDGTVEVVDYKFGSTNHEAYREQVRDYVSLLADAGYPGAKGFLWFPVKNEIIRVV